MAIVRADHALSGKGAVTLRDLAASPLVMREPGSGVRRLVERAFADAGLTPSVGLELAGVEGVKQAVRAGLGVGFVSVMSMRHEDGALAALRLLPRPLTRTLSILVPHADAAARAAGASWRCAWRSGRRTAASRRARHQGPGPSRAA